MYHDPEDLAGLNDADLETLELAERASEIAHAIRRGYCIGCDHQSGPHTYRLWRPSQPGGGHTTEQHPGVGPINKDGLCAECAERIGQ